jgi:hypothetical protein
MPARRWRVHPIVPVENAQLLHLMGNLPCHHFTVDTDFLPSIATSLEDLKGAFSPSSKAKNSAAEIHPRTLVVF